MKALSFRQPWAELVLQGRKTLDLRTYPTTYRGRIAIHVSQTVERDACAAHGLDPDALPTGGLVGSVELVEIVPLDEATYDARRDAHLAGRHFRPGLFGWALARPERLPALVPLAGQRRLFEVAEGELSGVSEDSPRATRHAPPPPLPRVEQPAPRLLNGTTAEKPFAVTVQPTTGATDYALTIQQRVAERTDPEPHLARIVTLGGDNLRAVADHVIEALRRADYKATDLSPARRKPFYLPEEVGVRLGLVCLAVKPLTKYRRMEQVSHGIRQMPTEEVYYWYSKCTAADTAERARQALRVLLAAE